MLIIILLVNSFNFLHADILDYYMTGILPAITQPREVKDVTFKYREIQDRLVIKDATGQIVDAGEIADKDVTDAYRSMVFADKQHYYNVGIKGDLLVNGTYTGMYDEPLAQLDYDADRLYVLKYAGSIDVLDVSKRSTPKRIKSIDTGKLYNKIKLHGGYLYALANDGTLDIFDTQTFEAVKTYRNIAGYLYIDFSVSDEKFVLATHNGLVEVYNQGDTPDAIAYDTTLELFARRVELDGHYLAIIDTRPNLNINSDLAIVDLNKKKATNFIVDWNDVTVDTQSHTFIAMRDAGSYVQYIGVQIKDGDVYVARLDDGDTLGTPGGVLYSKYGYLYTTDFWNSPRKYRLPSTGTYELNTTIGTAVTEKVNQEMFFFPSLSWYNYREKPHIVDERLALIPISNTMESRLYLIDYQENKVLSYFIDRHHRTNPSNAISIDGNTAYINTGFGIDVVKIEGDKLKLVRKAPYYYMNDIGCPEPDGAGGAYIVILNSHVFGMVAKNGMVFVEGDELSVNLAKIDLTDPNKTVYILPNMFENGCFKEDVVGMITRNSGNGVIMRLINDNLYLFDMGVIGPMGQFRPLLQVLEGVGQANPVDITPSRDDYYANVLEITGNFVFYENGYSKLNDWDAYASYVLSPDARSVFNVDYHDPYYYLFAENAVYLLKEDNGTLVEQDAYGIDIVNGQQVAVSDEKLFVLTYEGKVRIFDNRLLENENAVLKKTGQIKSFDTNGNEVTDNSIKDDGYYQTGVLPRYTRDDATGIVTDHVTGLQWQDDVDSVQKPWLTQDNFDNCQNGDNDACYDTSGDTAATYCETLSLDGGNWRLPTAMELDSIVDYSRNGPAIDPIFQSAEPLYYWSSTTRAVYEDRAWGVYFGDGERYIDGKDGANAVRCVR